MALNLPRLQRVVALVDRSGNPTIAFHQWWQSVAKAIENQVTDLLDLISRVTTNETDISSLDGRVGTSESAITAAQSDITALEAQDVAFASALAAETGSRIAADVALDTRVDSLEAFQAGTPALSSGVWTPTLTGMANVAASTAYQCQYLRIGDMVTASGKMDIQASSAGASTQIGISLPIASNFANSRQCGGAGAPFGANSAGPIYSDGTNDRAEFNYISADTANRGFSFSFTYRII